MPSARIEPEGTWTLGYSFARPYVSLYNNVSFFPFLELTLTGFRIMTPHRSPGFAGYGDYKDKRLDAKLRLLDETESLPALAVGMQDAYGTRLFGAEYLVASKRFGDLDLSLGYARSQLTSLGVNDVGVSKKDNRLEGLFGGARWRLSDSWAVVAERDATRYENDKSAAQTRVAERRGRNNVGLEYQWGWLGAQLSRQGEEWGVNGYVRIPLERPDFVPKIEEPEPYTKLRPRPWLSQWIADERYRREMALLLAKQDFQDIAIGLEEPGVLTVRLANHRISKVPRAVGRAARTVLLNAPVDVREIRITYAQGVLPLVTYSFFDLDRLQKYFNGQITRRELAQYVDIRYAAPEGGRRGADTLALIDEMEVERDRPLMELTDDEGNLLSFRRRGADLGRFSFVPLRLSTVINDPSGFFQYQIYSELGYTKRLGRGLFLDTAVNFRLYDTFRDNLTASNSPLPHVRSDAPLYVRASRLKLGRLALSQYFQPAERIYGRVSVGILEDMFSGVGGQLLYLPPRGPWAADVSVDAVRQRDFDGRFKHRDYSTVAALGALHYRFPKNFIVTARAGRFLARDKGVRFELKRRFQSGIELGGWYAVTDNQDFTSSSSPGEAYRDKGVFLNVPFDVMLTKDTRARASFAVAEWGRDVGQMVLAPRELYGGLEKSLIDLSEGDGLSRFGDVDDDYNLPSLGTGTSALDRPLWRIARNDFADGVGLLASLPTWGKIGLGVGAVGLSAALDNKGLRLAESHGQNRWVRGLRNLGNGLPLIAGGAALALALDGRDRRLADSGFAAVQAAAVGVLASEGLKYAIHRSRPEEGKGRADFNAASRGDSSMPSIHTTVAWAVATPFAKEYDAPWLYGAAALTNFARISGKKHWVSDTVAGSLLGYALGSVFWDWRRQAREGAPSVTLAPNGVTASWEFR